MTPTSTTLTCHLGSWLNASLRCCWKWSSLRFWALWAVLSMLGKRISMSWVCGFGPSVSSWVVLVASKELGNRWTQAMESGAEKDLGDHPIPPFQTDVETPEPRGVKWLTQGHRMNSSQQQPGQNPVLFLQRSPSSQGSVHRRTSSAALPWASSNK